MDQVVCPVPVPVSPVSGPIGIDNVVNATMGVVLYLPSNLRIVSNSMPIITTFAGGHVKSRRRNCIPPPASILVPVNSDIRSPARVCTSPVTAPLVKFKQKTRVWFVHLSPCLPGPVMLSNVKVHCVCPAPHAMVNFSLICLFCHWSNLLALTLARFRTEGFRYQFCRCVYAIPDDHVRCERLVIISAVSRAIYLLLV
jgi:hypothetical protein